MNNWPFFILGIAFGPAAFLFASAKQKGSISATIKGCFCFFLLVLVGWRISANVQKRNEERARERQCAYEHQMKVQLAEKERLFTELQERKKAVECLSKEIGLPIDNFKLRQWESISEYDSKEKIESMLRAAKEEHSELQAEQARILEEKKLKEEYEQNQKALAREMAARQMRENERQAEEMRVAEQEKLEAEKFAFQKEQEKLKAIAKKMINKLDLSPSSCLMYHKYLASRIRSGRFPQSLKELREAKKQGDYLKFLNLAAKDSDCEHYVRNGAMYEFPDREGIQTILASLRDRLFEIELTFQEGFDVSQVSLVQLQAGGGILGDELLEDCNYSCSGGIMYVPMSVGRGKMYLIEKGAAAFLNRELKRIKQKQGNMQKKLEELLSKDVSYDEVRALRLKAEQDRIGEEARRMKNAKREHLRMKNYDPRWGSDAGRRWR